MLDEIGEFIVRGIFWFLLKLIFYIIALIVCTPFILGRAIILALLDRQKFCYAVADGYGAISDTWWP